MLHWFIEVMKDRHVTDLPKYEIRDTDGVTIASHLPKLVATHIMSLHNKHVDGVRAKYKALLGTPIR
jgi:hypothetical protein